jgi:lysophospholipase L1-like esterase
MSTSDHPYMKERAWRDAKAFQPDVVLIKLGTNDSKDFQWNQEQYERDYQLMIDTLRPLVPVLNKKGKPTKKMVRAAKPAIYLCTPIKAFRDKWGITDSVIVNGVIPTIRRVAERNGLPVIDLHPVVDDPSLMTSDMIHPNDRGARRIAETIKEKIGGER